MPEIARSSMRRAVGHRLIALVGPFQSGKTTLLESILARCGAVARQGSVREASTVGDASAEARAHAMSTEANVASIDYMGERFTFIDCPGSIEFADESRNVLSVCDAAIVVCEAEARKTPALQLVFRQLEEDNVPRFLFLNKIDAATARLHETLAMLQPASRAPLLLRQIPIWTDGIATGFIDLALERAFVYREHAPSAVVEIPDGELPREKEARYSMLERLADYDDALMEELLTDIDPPRDQVFDDLTREQRNGTIVPLLIGSAEHGNGVTRLLKALRHEAPGIAETRERLSIAAEGPSLAHVVRTIHTAHGGKQSLARVMRGRFVDGMPVVASNGSEDRIASLARMVGAMSTKCPDAAEGDTLAFGRLDHIATGESFGDAKTGAVVRCADRPAAPPRVHCLALKVRDRKDEVKLAAALTRLADEDCALRFEQDQSSGEMKLHGRGEMHLRVTLERLAARYGVQVSAQRPSVAYRETIRHPVSVRGRHKKQSGGHGQFGDVVLDVKPLSRGDGFHFSETVHGGSVPRNYFGSVEAGCRDACTRGPLGFQVVDVAATLTDGSYHTVDSSDMAFRTAARVGMSDALTKAGPALLEPILSVLIEVPNDATSRVTAIVSGRRGQILGFDRKPDWENWDVVDVQIPEAEMHGLIVDLRSATAGVGTFSATFDHLAELSGKAADQVVQAAGAARAAAAAH
jgi:elongation factor G